MLLLNHTSGVPSPTGNQLQNYFDGPDGHGRQWTSYVVLVKEEYKSSSPDAVDFVLLGWPGGYLDGGEERNYPLLANGEEYIFFTTAGPRELIDQDGNSIQEEHGEEWLSSQRWGAVGLGIVKVERGRVVPPFGQLAARYRDYLSQGGDPVLVQAGRSLVPIWEISLGQYSESLRSVLPPEHWSPVH